MLIVGTEWLIEAAGCDPEALRDTEILRALAGRAVRELDLRVVGEPLWHKFPGGGGVTGLLLLSESHLACHTYPEFRIATFNLYCCRARPRWEWEERLGEALGASVVTVREFERSEPAEACAPAGMFAEESGSSAVGDAEVDTRAANASEAGGGGRDAR